MILHLNDWRRYPHAIVDTKTNNTSFLRMAELYRNMGINNHAFMLALMQPELQGLDPFSDTLTQEQKLMIGLECRFNIWYYLREIARFSGIAGSDPIRYRANRGNIALTWLFLNHIDTALIQPRQTGKSGSVDALSNWILNIGTESTKMMMITKDDTLRADNVDRLKAIRDLMPPFLYTLLPNDANNQKEITNKTLNNEFKTGVARNSENAANNLGRGLTTPILHIDEGPFINFIGVVIPAALAAAGAARTKAAESGAPYGNIFTTTAGKKDDRDGRYMYNLIKSGAVWSEAFLDAGDAKRAELMVKQNCSGRKIIVDITMSHKQLGYTDQWLYDEISRTNASGEEAERDYLNIWTSGTQRSPLTPALNEKILDSEREVKYSEISKEGYIFRWYVEDYEIPQLMEDTWLILGADTSEAVGRDAIGLTLTDIRDLGVVGAGTYNETNLARFAYYLASLLIKYPKITLVIERKSTGQMILDYLVLILVKAGIDPFTRIYNKIVDEYGEKPEEYRELATSVAYRSDNFYDQRKATFGFVTSASSRMLLYSTVLQNAAKQAGHLVRDKTISSEIRGLVEKNGRIDHRESGHDDHVIAWLLTHWFVHYGRNLSHYGIDRSLVMCALSKPESEKEDPLASIQRERQKGYLEEIRTVAEQLKDTSDPMLIDRMEHKIRFLSSKIVDQTGDEHFNLDAFLNDIAEERSNRTRFIVQQSNQSGSGGGMYRGLDLQRDSINMHLGQRSSYRNQPAYWGG